LVSVRRSLALHRIAHCANRSESIADTNVQ